MLFEIKNRLAPCQHAFTSIEQRVVDVVGGKEGRTCDLVFTFLEIHAVRKVRGDILTTSILPFKKALQIDTNCGHLCWVERFFEGHGRWALSRKHWGSRLMSSLVIQQILWAFGDK